MKRRETIIFLWVAAFFTVIIILIFLALDLFSVFLVAAVLLIVMALTFLLTSAYLRLGTQLTIESMTNELKEIAHSMEEKDYSHYSTETMEFYRALAEVKQTYVQRDVTRKEILEIVHSVVLNMELENVLRELMPKLLELTGSNCCAFYSVNKAKKLVLKHSIGFGKNIYNEFDLQLGEGFVGHTALHHGITIINEIPEDTIYMMRTFLGKVKPRNMMVVPIHHLTELNGVLVCASLKAYTEENQALVDMIKYYLGVAVGNGIHAEKNKRLTNELSFQNKLIQDQHEDMRKRLSDKEQLLSYFINLSGTSCFILDINGRVMCWSKRAEAMYGRSWEWVSRRHIDEIHAELGWHSMTGALQGLLEQGSYDYHICVKGGEGQKRDLDFQLAYMMNERNDPIGISVVVIEITDSEGVI